MNDVQGATDSDHVDQNVQNDSDQDVADLEESESEDSDSSERNENESETHDAGTDFRGMADDDDAQDQFAQALLGQNYSELTAQEQQIIDQLIADILAGNINVEVVDEGGNVEMEDGVDGAFVAGENGEPGTIYLASGLSKEEREAALREEFGEAVASHAEDLGLDLADGDAGARLVLVKNGDTVSKELTPDLFEDHDSDHTIVTIDGVEHEAEARNITGSELDTNIATIGAYLKQNITAIYFNDDGDLVIEGTKNADGSAWVLTISTSTDASGVTTTTATLQVEIPSGEMVDILFNVNVVGVGDTATLIHGLNELFDEIDVSGVEGANLSGKFNIEFDYETGEIVERFTGNVDLDQALTLMDQYFDMDANDTVVATLNADGTVTISGESQDGTSFEFTLAYSQDENGEWVLTVTGLVTDIATGVKTVPFPPVVITGQEEVLNTMGLVNKMLLQHGAVVPGQNLETLHLTVDPETGAIVEMTGDLYDIHTSAVVDEIPVNAEAGAVVGDVEIFYNGKWVPFSELPPAYRDVVKTTIEGGNGAFGVNDLGQIVIVDPTLLPAEGEEITLTITHTTNGIASTADSAVPHTFVMVGDEDSAGSVHASATAGANNSGEEYVVEVWDEEKGEWVTIEHSGGDEPTLNSISGTSVTSPTSGLGWGNDDVQVRVRNVATGDVYNETSLNSDGTSVLTETQNADGTITYSFNIEGVSFGLVLTDIAGPAVEQPEPPFEPAIVGDAQSEALSDYTQFLLDKDPSERTPDEQLFLDLMEAWAIAQDPAMEGRADIDAIEADLGAVMATDDVSTGLLAFEDLAMAAHTDAGLTTIEAAETLAAYMTSDEFLAYLESLPPEERTAVIDYYIANLTRLSPAIAQQTLIDVMGAEYTSMVEDGVAGDFSGYDKENLDSSVQIFLDFLVNAGRMSTGAALAFMDSFTNLTGEEQAKFAALLSKFLREGGDLSEVGAFETWITSEAGVSETVLDATLQVIGGLRDSGLITGVWAGLAALSAYEILSDGDLNDPVTQMRLAGDIMQTIAGLGGVTELFVNLGLAAASVIGSVFGWAVNLSDAARNALAFSAQDVDFTNPADIKTFMEDYEEEFYNHGKLASDPAYADATQEQIDGVLDDMATDLADMETASIASGEGPMVLKSLQDEGFIDLAGDVSRINFTSKTEVLAFLRDKEEFYYTQAKGPNDPDYANATQADIDSVIDGAADDLVAQENASIAAGDGPVVSKQLEEEGLLAPGDEPASEGILDLFGSRSTQVRDWALDGIEELFGMTVTEMVTGGYDALLKVLGELGFLGAASNLFFGAADVYEGIEAIKNGDDFDGSMQLLMGVDELGPIGIAGTFGYLTGSGELMAVLGYGVEGLLGLAFIKFVGDEIISEEKKKEAEEFLESGVSNGENYLLGASVEEEEEEQDEYDEFIGEDEGEG